MINQKDLVQFSFSTSTHLFVFNVTGLNVSCKFGLCSVMNEK
jgi:hypothetical protein